MGVSQVPVPLFHAAAIGMVIETAAVSCHGICFYG